MVTVNFACGLYDRMVPLYTGEVKPEGIDLRFNAIDSPREIFDRMAGKLEFDACEMSSSELIARTAAGQAPFVAIPAFPSRVFRHSFIFINRRAGIRRPKDLEGKRVGVPLYTMSAAIWIRGHLQHDYGVDLSKIQWVQGATNMPGSHGSPTVLPLLKPVAIEDNRSGRSLSELLEANEIAALAGAEIPAAHGVNPDVERLFPNFREIEKEFYRRTKIFPIMHLVVIRRDLHERHPEVAPSLYRALVRSKEIALRKMHYIGATRYMLPWLADDLDELREVFGEDPWPYGIEASRPTLEALVTYMAEQAMIARPMPIEELFVPVE